MRAAPRPAPLCYKLSIIPLEEEVLMRKLARRLRATQQELFHPPRQIPNCQKLPREIKHKTVELLAQLLREHRKRIRVYQRGKDSITQASGVALLKHRSFSQPMPTWETVIRSIPFHLDVVGQRMRVCRKQWTCPRSDRS